jgi:hypothetical protein
MIDWFWEQCAGLIDAQYSLLCGQATHKLDTKIRQTISINIVVGFTPNTPNLYICHLSGNPVPRESFGKVKSFVTVAVPTVAMACKVMDPPKSRDFNSTGVPPITISSVHGAPLQVKSGLVL